MDSLLTYLQQFISEERKARIEKVLNERTRHFTIAVEDIFQSHNANAIIRSAECFGIQDVHVIENRNEFDARGKVNRGAIKWVDVYTYDSSTKCIGTLREKGYQIVATTPHKDNVLLEKFDVSKPSAFFFGTERTGLKDAVLQAADCHLRIPMFGFTESFNVSVSASLILQHTISKLKNDASIYWQLSEKEKEVLRLQWTKERVRQADMHIRNYNKLVNT